MPENHLVRKLENLLDFSFIYPLVEDLYSKDNGNPSIDPVALIKYLLLGYLFGIASERRIEKEIEVNVAYRWFLGLNLFHKVPHHSTISQVRKRKFNSTDIFRKIFENIVFQCMNLGLVSGKIISTDSTHIKANTSKQSELKVLVRKESLAYTELLDHYEKEERKQLESAGMKPQRKSPNMKKEPKMIKKVISITDSDAGYMRRGNKPLGMHYLSHQSMDSAYGIIVDVKAIAGNVNDSVPYIERINYMKNAIKLPIEVVGVDSAYNTSLIHHVLSEQDIDVCTPMKGHGKNSKAELVATDFQYLEDTNSYFCPNGKELIFRSLDRTDYNILKEYRTKPSDCKYCSYQKKCLAPSQKPKKIQMNIFNKAVGKSQKRAKTKEYQEILNLRQIWCEGNFANQKRDHNLARLQRQGISAVEEHCLLSATAFNLKRMIRCIG